MLRLLNYILSIPWCGFAGTLYLGHTEDSSTCLARFGYDARRMELDVHFVQGRSLYRYYGVPIWVVILLAAASLSDRWSVGRVFNDRIRNQYQSQMLTWYPPTIRRRFMRKSIHKHLKSEGVSPRQRIKRIKALQRFLAAARGRMVAP